MLLVAGSISCKRQSLPQPFSGSLVGPFGEELAGISVIIGDDTVVTDNKGEFSSLIDGRTTLLPQDDRFYFVPSEMSINTTTPFTTIQGFYAPNDTAGQVLQWLAAQQLDNGLLESAEGGNNISLYDQALAALVFMATGQTERATKILDFFANQLTTEAMLSPGGFSQFRNREGTPNNHRWMGDNAWLLMAIQYHHAATQQNRYSEMATVLETWLRGLQDTDGGLWAGYASDNSLLSYKVTEGMIDAFAAVPGYDSFHRQLLAFLAADRWDPIDKNLMAWPTNPPYKWALDNFSWAYCAFPDYPVTTLDAADRFRTTQTVTLTGQTAEGYDIDEDREIIFMEGTGQMAVAFHAAGRFTDQAYWLANMEKAFTPSTSYTNTGGFPYASNTGSGYGTDPLWPTAHSTIALSAGVWYVFGQIGFNPLHLGQQKAVPQTDRFW